MPSEARAADAFVGQSEAALRIGDLTLGRWTADAWGDAVEPHGHDRAHFMFVLGGRYASAVAGEPAGAAPLMIFNPAGTWHGDRFEEPGTFLSIEIGRDPARDEPEFAAPGRSVRLASPRAFALMRSVRRALGQRHDPALHAEALVTELVGELSRRRLPERARPRWLVRTIERIRDESERALSVAALAGTAGVHPVHLTRTFRDLIGCTPGEYQLRVRLARAAEALRDSTEPLAEIADAAGFADQSHFTARFRAVYGVPPGAYRRRLR